MRYCYDKQKRATLTVSWKCSFCLLKHQSQSISVMSAKLNVVLLKLGSICMLHRATYDSSPQFCQQNWPNSFHNIPEQLIHSHQQSMSFFLAPSSIWQLFFRLKITSFIREHCLFQNVSMLAEPDHSRTLSHKPDCKTVLRW